jgi:hypothetical protein
MAAARRFEVIVWLLVPLSLILQTEFPAKADRKTISRPIGQGDAMSQRNLWMNHTNNALEKPAKTGKTRRQNNLTGVRGITN